MESSTNYKIQKEIEKRDLRSLILIFSVEYLHFVIPLHCRFLVSTNVSHRSPQKFI